MDRRRARVSCSPSCTRPCHGGSPAGASRLRLRSRSVCACFLPSLRHGTTGWTSAGGIHQPCEHIVPEAAAERQARNHARATKHFRCVSPSGMPSQDSTLSRGSAYYHANRRPCSCLLPVARPTNPLWRSYSPTHRRDPTSSIPVNNYIVPQGCDPNRQGKIYEDHGSSRSGPSWWGGWDGADVIRGCGDELRSQRESCSQLERSARPKEQASQKWKWMPQDEKSRVTADGHHMFTQRAGRGARWNVSAHANILKTFGDCADRNKTPSDTFVRFMEERGTTRNSMGR